MSAEKLLQKLYSVIRDKIEVKVKKVVTPEKYLLDCFKYFDSADLGFVNYSLFEKVILMKLNINVFNKEELVMIYTNLLDLCNGRNQCIKYRDFIMLVMGVTVNIHS